MKNLLISLWIIAGSIASYAQNGTIKATFVDNDKQVPISSYPVWLNTTKFMTNEKGELNALVPYGTYILVVSGDEFETFSQKIELNSNEFDAGSIKLVSKSLNTTDVSTTTEQVISTDDMDNDKADQNISGLLHFSNDAFVSIATYSLGAGNFRMRGYDASNYDVYINGLPMNDAESGRASYSDWGGLNNVTRNQVFSTGIDATNYAFGNIGGSSNMLMDAGNIRKQNNLSYAFSNASFTHRLMYTFATGMNEKGWAFAFSLSKRYSEKGYVKGTWYDAYSYYASAEKKWNDKHSTGLTIFGSPYKRAMQAPATQECYDLVGSNYYNPNWGYQDGIVRNAKVRNVHQPMTMLTDKYTFSDKLNLTTSIGYQFGRFGTTALNWYNANDPRPDYYRYLPSYQNDTIDPYAQIYTTQNWTSSPDNYQINWDKLYQTNYLANIAGEPAHYIVEEQRKDNSQASYNSHLTWNIKNNTTISAGINGIIGKTHYFKTVNDLLGANYWLDVDQFAARDFPQNNTMLENDLNNPDRHVKVGDIFGYNYDIDYSNHNLWALFQQKLSHVDYFLQAQGSYSSFWRKGYMKNGRYPDHSYGKSEVNSFMNYAVKAGVTYKITGRHFLEANVAILSAPPIAENSFINARTSDRVVSNLINEQILSGDASYIYRGIIGTARITAYQTYFNNQTEIHSYYDDQLLTFVNILMQNVDEVHQGIEVGAEVKLNMDFSLTGGYNLGNYRYTSRPNATVTYDNGSKADTTETIYQKNFYVPGPQQAGSFGIKYRNSKYWMASANINVFDKNYLEFAPERRTVAAIANLGPGDPQIATITEQQKLDGGYTIDLSVGKSWKIGTYTLAFNASVKNLLDNKELISGGYEQMRYDYTTHDIGKFPPKYFYGYGRSYLLMLTFRF
jgi:hypothetical protein